jgi:hypothetical protein
VSFVPLCLLKLILSSRLLVLKSKSNFFKMKQVIPQILFLVAIVFIISCSNAPSSKNESTQASGDLKRQGKTLKLLCWEGYASDKFSEVFEAQTGIKVDITTFKNSQQRVKVHLTLLRFHPIWRKHLLNAIWCNPLI